MTDLITVDPKTNKAVKWQSIEIVEEFEWKWDMTAAMPYRYKTHKG